MGVTGTAAKGGLFTRTALRKHCGKNERAPGEEYDANQNGELRTLTAYTEKLNPL